MSGPDGAVLRLCGRFEPLGGSKVSRQFNVHPSIILPTLFPMVSWVFAVRASVQKEKWQKIQVASPPKGTTHT